MANMVNAITPASGLRNPSTNSEITNIVVIDEIAPSCFHPIRRPNARRITYKGRHGSVMRQSKNSRTPTMVATPLPPFQPRNGLQQCPRIAATPYDQSTAGVLVVHVNARIAKEPLL